MSEQKESSFMQELEQWIENNVFAPLLTTGEDGESEELSDKTLDYVKHAIKDQVLQSYKNGIKAGIAKAHQAQERNGQATGSKLARPTGQSFQRSDREHLDVFNKAIDLAERRGSR